MSLSNFHAAPTHIVVVVEVLVGLDIIAALLQEYYVEETLAQLGVEIGGKDTSCRESRLSQHKYRSVLSPTKVI
jgi:hypothetical protein